MKTVFFGAVIAAALATSASASSYVLDFDGPDPSLDSTTTQTVSNPRIFTDDGISWEVTTGGGLGAALFDSTCTG